MLFCQKQLSLKDLDSNCVMLKIIIGIGLGFLVFTNQSARQTTADILRFGADALSPEVYGPTLQEQFNKVLEGD